MPAMQTCVQIYISTTSPFHASIDELINLFSRINRNNLSRECFYFVISLLLRATGIPEALWSDKFACHLAWAAGI